jgi:Plasmid encoded RepA protein
VNQLIHRRRNGQFVLEICAHPDYGLPFGQDRLALIWVASLAVKQKSRVVSFESGSQILREFDLPVDGPHYRRMIEAFRRIFSSTIYFGMSRNRADAMDCARVHFFDALDLWFSPRAPQDVNRRENVVVLSEAFWEELRTHPIPVRRETVSALASSPGCLDLYLWLAWRTFKLSHTQRVPVGGLHGLAFQLGSDPYGRPRDFERTLRKWLERIRAVWPECSAQIEENGRTLLIGEGRNRRPIPVNQES